MSLSIHAGGSLDTLVFFYEVSPSLNCLYPASSEFLNVFEFVFELLFTSILCEFGGESPFYVNGLWLEEKGTRSRSNSEELELASLENILVSYSKMSLEENIRISMCRCDRL